MERPILHIPRKAGSMMLDKSTIAKMKIEGQIRWEEIKRQNQIRSNSCPSCEGELVRGKRNKNNGYKREWSCKKCSEIHTI